MSTTQKPLRFLAYNKSAVGAPTNFEKYVYYVEMEDGTITFENASHKQVWYAGGGISDFSTSVEGKSLVMTITLGNGSTIKKTLFTVADTQTITLGLAANGTLTANVRLDPSSTNILGTTANGLTLTMKQEYVGSTGALETYISKDNGTTWVKITDVLIPFDSVFVSALFVKTQAEWDSNPRGKAMFGAATIAEPSLVVTVKTASTPPTYSNAVIPAKGLFLEYILTSTDNSMTLTKSEDSTGTVITYDMGVKISANQATSNVGVEKKSDGVLITALMTVIED